MGRSKLAAFFIACFILLAGFARADFESDVVELINLERKAQGLHPLASDGQLANAARDHSSDMGLQGYFNHDSLDGRKFYERILDAGYAYSYCGENIAAGYSTPESVVEGWMNSPGHRANILEPDFCDIGVGYAYIPGSPYGHYWTQDFGAKSGVSECPGLAVYTIEAGAGSGGSISPAGAIKVAFGGSQTFTITPDTGYSVQDVSVDDASIGIVRSYTFSDIDRDHAIQASFSENTAPPVADAGPGQVAETGDTVTLDGSNSRDPNDGIVSYRWVQTNGPQTSLSDENAATPTFVATSAMVNSTLTFKLTVSDTGGESDSDSVQVEIFDNGIRGFPADAFTFYSASGKAMAIKVEGGGTLISLNPRDPEHVDASTRSGMPQNLIYGLIDFEIKVGSPGDETSVAIYLPEPIPAGYKWFKYKTDDGWYDFSNHAAVNSDGEQVRLTLVDGGSGDDDGNQDGVVRDPLGLGTLSSNTDTTESGGGGAACFIVTAFSSPVSTSPVAAALAGWMSLLWGCCLVIFPLNRNRSRN